MHCAYSLGKDWNDVAQNCHQPCPSGNNVECENPEHSCWAFVLACKVDTSIPVDADSSLSPATGPVTPYPDSPLTLDISEAPVPSGEPTSLTEKEIDNEGEAWDNGVGGQIDNEGESFDNTTQSQTVDNEGESWESNNQVDNENEDWDQSVDNEGEGWSSNSDVNNEGEEWDSPQPSIKPEPAVPTAAPTADPTIDLMEHLETMKRSYFCSETWENIDCERAQSCPSGDSKGEIVYLPIVTLVCFQSRANCNYCLGIQIVLRNKNASVVRLANPVNRLQTINQPVEDLQLRMHPKMKVLAQPRPKQQSMKPNQIFFVVHRGKLLLKVVKAPNLAQVAQMLSAKAAKLALRTHLVVQPIPTHLEKLGAVKSSLTLPRWWRGYLHFAMEKPCLETSAIGKVGVFSKCRSEDPIAFWNNVLTSNDALTI